MKFLWATINVKDTAKSVSFYQDIIGLKLTRQMKPNPEMEIVFLGLGDTQIELIYHTKKTDPNFGQDISLGFEVDSLENIMAILKEKNIPIQAGPFQPNPFIKFIYVLDPDGLKIQFVENIK